MIKLFLSAFALSFMFYSDQPKTPSPSAKETILIAFGDESPSYWSVVNDGVMGGLSSSIIRMSDEGHAVFEGNVSLENNGGFASVRTRASAAVDLSGFDGFTLRASGDDKLYSIRIKTVHNGRLTAYAWEATFRAESDWETHQFRAEDFKPVFRGRDLSDTPPLNLSAVGEIGIMIKDAQEGAFTLNMEHIGVFRTQVES